MNTKMTKSKMKNEQIRPSVRYGQSDFAASCPSYSLCLCVFVVNPFPNRPSGDFNLDGVLAVDLPEPFGGDGGGRSVEDDLTGFQGDHATGVAAGEAQEV